MNVIWLDVTTILHWQRPAVGIVRVEAECAKAALQQTRRTIKFCSFNNVSGFQEVDRQQVVAALERISGTNKPVMPTAKPAAQSAQRPALETRLLNHYSRLSKYLPRKLHTQLLSFITLRKAAIRDFIQALRYLKSATLGMLRKPDTSIVPMATASSQPASSVNCIFDRGDIYLSLGLDWDTKNIVYLYDLKRQNGFRVLQFCYDIIPVKLPHLCVSDVAAKFAGYFANMAWTADKIVCISKCSERDLNALLTELGTPTPPTAVVTLGAELPTIDQRSAAPISGPYLLFVSTIERRKNHETLYRAYTRLVEAGVQDLPRLVFVGMPGWGVSDFLLDIKLDPRTQNLITILNHVSDEELSALYQNAFLTLYPSLYEGWGLPVVESLAYGKFCIASNAASLPEAGGEFVDYVDPWNVQAWSDRIKHYLDHPEQIAAKERHIRDNFKITSWAETAEFVLSNAENIDVKVPVYDAATEA